MDLTVIGTGTVGLVAGTSFAEAGNDVTCVDPDEERVLALSSAGAPDVTAALADLIRRNVAEKRLRFSTDARAAIRSAEVIFVAVGDRPDDDTTNLEDSLTVAGWIGEQMTGRKLVVTLGSVPVGTSRQIRSVIEERTAYPVHVCSSPDFPWGSVGEEGLRPTQIVLGVESEDARKVLTELFAPLVQGARSLQFMDVPSAEFSRFVTGGRLASRIGFMELVTRLGSVPRSPLGPVGPWVADRHASETPDMGGSR